MNAFSALGASSYCQEYIESIVQFLADSSRLAMYGGPQDRYRFRRVIWQSYENMVHTFTNLIEVSAVIRHLLMSLSVNVDFSRQYYGRNELKIWTLHCYLWAKEFNHSEPRSVSLHL